MFIFREAQKNDIPHMKHIRDNVRENKLVSCQIEILDYEKAFVDGKGWVCLREDLATHTQEIIGFSCGRLKQKDVWALFIDSRYEGKGIGNQLMALLEEWMFANGCEQIHLSTEAQTRAERLYRRRGWREMGRLANGEIEFCLRK